ncbi:MAG: prolyl oligopeptidase family serine peptidase [Abitibacteriaceae bacterium]|nr:prolyl oligopeptidase family serine peptidase [Abditibacteriaceae bacterium]
MLAILALSMCLPPVISRAEAETIKHSLWNGYERLDFVVDGRQCLLVMPKVAAPSKPWIWRMEFFGHEPQADIALLGKGFHVAYMDVQNMYGAPIAMGHMDAFYKHLIKEHKLALKVVLEGFSRGGLFAFNWAARNPDNVAAIYADAPVCDFKSWPGGKGHAPGSPADWELCKQAYGLTEQQALAYKLNPIDNLEPLAKAHIPLLHVCGETDDLVPMAENTRIVEQRYRQLGGSITVIAKPFNGHHPHSLQDPTHIVNFVLRNTPGMAQAVTAEAATPYGYDYFNLRGGLNNCRIKFEREHTGRVVFLGGSITAGRGWRDLVCEELKRRFPQTQFDFINAGIPSLGSTPGAFRFSRDVLAHGPVDLLFEEAAVNDETNGQTPVEQVRGMEGIVRQARLANPAMDIILLHFVDPDKMAVINAGKTPVVIANHEKVADYYHVPSIDLAKEVTERIHAGEFTWEKDFHDLHPSPFGHGVYFRSIKRLFDAAWKQPLAADARVQPYPLPAQPLDDKSYFRGRLVDVKAATLENGWTLDPAWQPTDKAGTRPGFVNVPALIAEQPGATLKLKFTGTAVGLFVASGPDAGAVEFRVDGGQTKARDLFTQWSSGLHLPWAQVLAADLPNAPHELELRVAQTANPKSKGHAVRIIYFLVN